MEYEIQCPHCEEDINLDIDPYDIDSIYGNTATINKTTCKTCGCEFETELDVEIEFSNERFTITKKAWKSGKEFDVMDTDTWDQGIDENQLSLL